jgi:hypothetical protein
MTPIQRLIRQISYSSNGAFRACERKFILDKATARDGTENIDLCFGKAVAAGCQTLWLTGNLDKATLEVFKEWTTSFEDEKQRARKSLVFAIRAVQLYYPYYLLLSKDWKLAELNGVPCIEFSLKIEFPDGFIYRAYTDLILQHRTSGELGVQEFKTDGGTFKHEAKYKNSDQGTSYSLVIDQLDPEASSFWVTYPVFYSAFANEGDRWEFYQFPKTLVDKAKWLRTTLLDIKHIQECEAGDYWPKRGGSCMAFGRPCNYFETCDFSDKALFSSDELLAKKVEEEEGKTYSFVVPIEKIVENYLS